MSLFTSLFGGSKNHHLIASGAAFATIWGFFLACIILLIVVSGVMLNDAMVTDDQSGVLSERKKLHYEVAGTGLGIAALMIIVLISIYSINDKWIDQFPVMKTQMIASTIARHGELIQ
jgi:hypothetical protein